MRELQAQAARWPGSPLLAHAGRPVQTQLVPDGRSVRRDLELFTDLRGPHGEHARLVSITYWPDEPPTVELADLTNIDVELRVPLAELESRWKRA